MSASANLFRMTPVHLQQGNHVGYAYMLALDIGQLVRPV